MPRTAVYPVPILWFSALAQGELSTALRPFSFESLDGQDETVTTLHNGIIRDKCHHPGWFSLGCVTVRVLLRSNQSARTQDKPPSILAKNTVDFL